MPTKRKGEEKGIKGKAIHSLLEILDPLLISEAFKARTAPSIALTA